MHSAFNLPIFKPGNYFGYRKPSNEELHKRHHLCKYFDSLVVDEVSVLGNKSLNIGMYS